MQSNYENRVPKPKQFYFLKKKKNHYIYILCVNQEEKCSVLNLNIKERFYFNTSTNTYLVQCLYNCDLLKN